MEPYRLLLRRVTLALCAAGFAALAAALYTDSTALRAFVLGIALGLLSLRLMARSLERGVAAGSAGAARAAVRYFLARYGIIGAGLLLMGRAPLLDYGAYAAGVLLPGLAMACISCCGRMGKEIGPAGSVDIRGEA